MDQKHWRWRRKLSEKTKDVNGRNSLSLERNFEEDRDNESESLRCSSNLSDRLPSVLCDCSVKEELIRKHRRIAEQALAGQEMERAEAAYLKDELEKALQEVDLAEKKLVHLSAALKDCTREIESLKEQQDERVQNAFSKAKLDCEKERTKLEAKLTEANRRISNLSSENANLMKALICKERLLHDLDNGKAELESELAVLTDRLESSTEKPDNGTRYLIEKVYTLEEENTTLRDILALSDRELQSWRIKCGQMCSRLTELDAQVLKLSGDENTMQLAISCLGLAELEKLEKQQEFKAVCFEYASFTKEKIRKRLSFDRSTSDLGFQSALQDENKRMNEELQKVTEEKLALRTEVRESKQIIESLQKEVGSFKESKGLIEDQIENQRLINEDLNTQLTVAKAKLNEIVHKLSSLEVELDHRNNCYDELESTCLELQLQLETISRKESPNTYLDAVAKQLFEQAISSAPVKKTLIPQGNSLRDRLLEEEYEEKADPKRFQAEEKSSDESPKKSIVLYTGNGNKPLPASTQKTSSPEQTTTLAVVSSKTTSRGFGFIRKLFFRRKKGCVKMKPVTLQRNTSALMKQRAGLLVV